MYQLPLIFEKRIKLRTRDTPDSDAFAALLQYLGHVVGAALGKDGRVGRGLSIRNIQKLRYLAGQEREISTARAGTSLGRAINILIENPILENSNQIQIK